MTGLNFDGPTIVGKLRGFSGYNDPMHIDDVISAARRSNRAWCEQLGMGESLDFGVAYASPEYPRLADANQLRDAWIADADPQTVYERVEAYYAERGLLCRMWTPASGQSVAPIESLLLALGWRRSDLTAMGLVSWDSENLPLEFESIRVLPARAMRRAYQSTVSDAWQGDSARIESAVDRLNDSHYDAFIAQIDGEPAGRIGYLEVGEIARLCDFWVSPAYHGRGVDHALAAHFLRTARRLLPRYIVACIDATDAGGRALLERHGFAVAGELPRFVRNTD